MPDQTATNPAGWNFDNTYSKLPSVFFEKLSPRNVADPKLVVFNFRLAEELGLDGQFLSEKGASVFVGSEIPAGADPMALAYAGHQFGHFTMLGDGRALLLGEHVASDGRRFDVHFKGSGPTGFSRRGDGLASLGPMLREYIISEAMAGLEIPTTRSLAVATTGGVVYRELILPGAVLTRIASSHIRVGTFEYAARIKFDAGSDSPVKTLADYAIARHFPELDTTDKLVYRDFLAAVAERQSQLIAKWLHVGFIHGVMNTDNMSISGETIDYGPCAFMDSYHPDTVFSSIDRQGRYSFSNQSKIAQWNLTRLAETLVPIMDVKEEQGIKLARDVLESFSERFDHHWLSGARKKLGLFNTENADLSLVNELLKWMEASAADFTNTFRNLADLVEAVDEKGVAARWKSKAVDCDSSFLAWWSRWQMRLGRQPQTKSEVSKLMNSSNPMIIPRNHQVESALKAAVEDADFSPVKEICAMLLKPFEETAESHSYTQPPKAGEEVSQTFCGT